MNGKFLYSILLLTVFVLLQQPIESSKKKIVIHVPYRVKNVKHTHTIYKLIPHLRKAREGDIGDEYDYRRR